MYLIKRSRTAFPFGNQIGKPAPTRSENINKSISAPSFLWSLFLASSIICRYSVNSFCLGNEIPLNRVICCRFSSPCQNAPPIFVILTALILEVSFKCGPLHKSTKPPCVYSVKASSSPLFSISSNLYSSPLSWKNLVASALEISCLTKAFFSLANSSIFFSIVGKSSEDNLRSPKSTS